MSPHGNRWSKHHEPNEGDYASQESDNQESKTNSVERTITFFYESMLGILLVLNSNSDNYRQSKNTFSASVVVVIEAAQLLGFIFHSDTGSVTTFADIFQFFHIEPVLSVVAGYGVISASAILIVVSLLFGGTYVGYSWATKGTQSPWIVTIIRAGIQLCTGVLYLPILLTFTRSLTCGQIENAHVSFSEASCNILAPFNIITGLSFIFVSFALIASVYDSSPKSRSAFSRPHARVELALLVVKTVTAVLWQVTNSASDQAGVATLLVAGYFAFQYWILCMLYIWYQPYYSMRILQLRAMSIAVVAWVALCEFGRLILRSAALSSEVSPLYTEGMVGYANNSTELMAMESYFQQYNGMMLVLTAIPLPIVVFLTLGYRHITLYRKPFHECRHEFEFELKVRLRLARLREKRGELTTTNDDGDSRRGSKVRLPNQSSAMEGEGDFRTKQQITFDTELESINSAYQEGLKRFSSPLFCVFYLEFLQNFKKDREQSLLMRSVILEAESRNPILDVHFAMIRKREQLKNIVDQNYGILHYVRARKLEKEARSGDQRACLLLVEFWDMLQEKHPEMEKVKPLATRIADSTVKARNAYRELLKYHKNNIVTLKLYAGFAADVYNSSAEATTYTLRANRIEAGQQVVFREPTKGKVRLDENWGIIEFDVMGIYHPFGDILSTNQNAARILNEPSNGLVGKDIGSYLVPPFSTNLKQVIRGFLENGKSDLVYQTLATHCISSQGNCFTSQLRLLPFSEDGIYYTFYLNVNLISSEGCFILVRENGRIVGSSSGASEFFASCCANTDGVVVPTKLRVNELFQSVDLKDERLHKGNSGTLRLAYPRENLQRMENKLPRAVSGRPPMFGSLRAQTAESEALAAEAKDEYTGPHVRAHVEPVEFGNQLYYYKLAFEPIVEPGRRFELAEDQDVEGMDSLLDSQTLQIENDPINRSGSELGILEEENSDESGSSGNSSVNAASNGSDSSDSSSESSEEPGAKPEPVELSDEVKKESNPAVAVVNKNPGARRPRQKMTRGRSQRKGKDAGSVASSTVSQTRHAVQALRANLQRQSYNNELHPTLNRLRKYYLFSLVCMASLCYLIHYLVFNSFNVFEEQVELSRQFGIRRYYALSIAFQTTVLIYDAFGVKVNRNSREYTQNELLEASENLLAVEELLFSRREDFPDELRLLYEEPTVQVKNEDNGFLITESMSLYDASVMLGGMGKQLSKMGAAELVGQLSMIQSLLNTIGQEGEGILEAYSTSTDEFTEFVQWLVFISELFFVFVAGVAFLIQVTVLLLVLLPAADRIESNKSQVLRVFSGIPRNSVKSISMRYRIRLSQVHDITIDDVGHANNGNDTRGERTKRNGGNRLRKGEKDNQLTKQDVTVKKGILTRALQILLRPFFCLCRRKKGAKNKVSPGKSQRALGLHRNNRNDYDESERLKNDKDNKYKVIGKLAIMLTVTAGFFVVYLLEGVWSQNDLMIYAPHWMEINSRQMAELRGGVLRLSEFTVGMRKKYHNVPAETRNSTSVLQHTEEIQDLSFELSYGGDERDINAKYEILPATSLGVLQFQGDISEYHEITFTDGCLQFEPVETCRTVSGGTMNRGVMNALRVIVRMLRDQTLDFDAIPDKPSYKLRYTNITVPAHWTGYYFGYTGTFANNTMNQPGFQEIMHLEHNFVQPQLQNSISIIQSIMRESMAGAARFRNYMIVSYTFLIIIIYVTVIRQVINQLDKEVKQTRSLLLMIPEDILEGLGSLQAFLMHEFRQYAQD